MASLIRMLSPAAGTGSNASTPSKPKKGDKDAEPEPEMTPLVKMLQNAGPVRPDGSDKFFGYCNSILQALYYSVPFRESVVKYPPHSPNDTPNGHLPNSNAPSKPIQANGIALSPSAKPKGLSAAEALRRRNAINAGQPPPPGQRAEDKPDSPEYKKKHAMMTGPILEITSEHASSYGMEETTFSALKDVFMAMIANPSRTGVVSPQRFLDVFRRDNEMFRTAMHQDAHEFYGLMLNAIISNVETHGQRMKELEPPKNNNSLTDSMTAAVQSAADSLGLSKGAESPGTGWVHDIFEGKMVSETKCLTCETASQRDETFLDLSIDLERGSSVTSCLRKFSAEEMLCERNKFHCDNCGGLQEAEKRMKIKKLPKVLVLHLKRFKYSDDMSRLQKLFYTVVYPYHLRMFNTTDDAEDPDRLYELYAVVVHIGANAFHGHYVSVIKTQDRGWLLFDDEMVEPVDKHYVRNFFGDKPGQACAYVLFYRETTEEAMRREQEAEGLAQVVTASQEAGAAMGHPQPNGTYPSSESKQVLAPSTPIDENNGFKSLDHALTAPLVTSPHTENPLATRVPTSPLNAMHTPKLKSKEEKEREKKAEKAEKEAEKLRKAAEKAAEKQAAKDKKDLEKANKVQDAEYKKAIAASKQTEIEEQERRRKGSISQKENLIGGDKPESKGFLSRSHRGSKSMSRKSLGFLSGGRNGDPSKSPDKNEVSIPETPTSSNTAVDGMSGPQTPEKYEKVKKERFSFGNLGRKKSNLWSPGGV
ncbi:ubiquitin carboxyl-terminal hydrolase protein [Rutstroemia sp. NJR-2017a WRK4]|nr:ubiquitin carboxyl-terminal hydrolase protein [Rutstroemia sp. NJR-2017a WRK4]